MRFFPLLQIHWGAQRAKVPLDLFYENNQNVFWEVFLTYILLNLLILLITFHFQGSYQCDPSNTAGATTRVFVLDGEWLENDTLKNLQVEKVIDTE